MFNFNMAYKGGEVIALSAGGMAQPNVVLEVV